MATRVPLRRNAFGIRPRATFVSGLFVLAALMVTVRLAGAGILDQSQPAVTNTVVKHLGQRLFGADVARHARRLDARLPGRDAERLPEPDRGASPRALPGDGAGGGAACRAYRRKADVPLAATPTRNWCSRTAGGSRGCRGTWATRRSRSRPTSTATSSGPSGRPRPSAWRACSVYERRTSAARREESLYG